VFLFLGADRTPGTLTLGAPAVVLVGVMRGTFEQGKPVEFFAECSGPGLPAEHRRCRRNASRLSLGDSIFR
jgi:hypothetical protein